MTLKRQAFTRGIRGYATIIASLRTRPATAQQLLARILITERQLLAILRQLHALRVVYVKGWIAGRSGGRNFSRVWGFDPDGSREDAPRPIGESGRVQSSASLKTSRPCLEVIAFQRLIVAMQCPQTPANLTEETGVSRAAVYKFLNHSHAIRLLHIADWETGMDKPYVAMFKIGRAADEPRPQRASNTERCAKYMRNRRAREDDQRVIRAIVSPLA